MAGWIKMPLGREVGLSPSDIMLYGAQLPPKGSGAPNFLLMSIVASTAGWIKMPLGMEVGLGLGHIVLDGTQLPLPKWAQPPIFSWYLLWPKWLDGSRCYLVGK